MARNGRATGAWTHENGAGFPTRAVQAALCLTVALLTDVTYADPLRCPDGIVDRGDRGHEVRARCAQPDHIESWDAAPPLAAGAVWFYNFGSSRLLRVLRFRDDRLVAIGSDGYGFTPPARADCRPGAAQRGWSAYRLVAYCGSPASREVVGNLLVPARPLSGTGSTRSGQRAVHRQRWRYDFGPRHFVREYTLDNAVITDVRTLDRGS